MLSVLISVYKSEEPEFFHIAIESIYNQTLKNFEVILVVDGSIPSTLDEVISYWEEKFGNRMKVIRIETNGGLANALNVGLQHCSYELVARMDSDDYSEPNRLEIQYQYMMDNPKTDVLGAQIVEFYDSIENISLEKKVHPNHNEIVNTIWLRNPMNHVTILFKRSSVLKVGGYDPQYGDDAYLWAKMYVYQMIFHNLNQNLVRVRVSKAGYRRRGGWKLLKWDLALRQYLYKNGKIRLARFLLSSMIFTILRFMPSIIRKFIYHKLARKELKFSQLKSS